MFEIGLLEFGLLEFYIISIKLSKDKLKALAGLDHIVHFLANHLEMFAMRIVLFTSFHSQILKFRYCCYTSRCFIQIVRCRFIFQYYYRVIICLLFIYGRQGRRPRGDWGDGPPKFEGDGPCIRPPNILRSSVVRCARKYEQSKERSFCCEERAYTTFRPNIVKIRKIWEKKGKIRKTWSMTKKKSSEIFAVKLEIFPEKSSFRNLAP